MIGMSTSAPDLKIAALESSPLFAGLSRRHLKLMASSVLGAAAMIARAEAELTAVAAGQVQVLVASHQQLNQLIACPPVGQRLREQPKAIEARMAVSSAA